MSPEKKHHHPLLRLLVGFLLLIAISVMVVVVYLLIRDEDNAERQRKLAPFYTVNDSQIPGKPGSLIRTEPIDFAPSGSRGWRVLFRSQGPDGEATISSGMVFAPDSPTNTGKRPVVAWAHGTVGQGESCAPSRSKQPLDDMSWLAGMLRRGWVVTAPDYAGLGTEGVNGFLVGKAEAHDVLNSVRAARELPETTAGRRFAIWGHSQGGHSSLFAGKFASSYAPELELVAESAAAPAAELLPLIHQQYSKVVSWAIGPEVSISWPATYPGVELKSVLSKSGLAKYRRLATLCIVDATLIGLTEENLLSHDFFAHDPTKNPAWKRVMRINTVPLPPTNTPVFIAQGLADKVVLPNTTALLIKRYCNAGVSLTTDWLPGVTHAKTAIKSGPRVTAWLVDRFAGRPSRSSCGSPLPVQPAS